MNYIECSNLIAAVTKVQNVGKMQNRFIGCILNRFEQENLKVMK